MNCIHCKSKDIRQKRVSENGNIQYQCKKCKKYFTAQSGEKKPEKKPEKKEPKRCKDETDFEDTFGISRYDMFCSFSRSAMEQIEDLESRLDHADKVNMSNLKLMQDIRAENHKLSMKVSYRNVAICLLVAGLALASGMLFY